MSRQSRRGATCHYCGALHESRPQAAREGWEKDGGQTSQKWVCPDCKPKLNAERQAEYDKAKAAYDRRLRELGVDPEVRRTRDAGIIKLLPLLGALLS